VGEWPCSPRTARAIGSSSVIRVKTEAWPSPRRRISVDDFDEPGNGRLAIADDVRGLSPGGGNELLADHQEPVIRAFDELLDEDSRPFGLSRRDKRRRPVRESSGRWPTPRP